MKGPKISRRRMLQVASAGGVSLTTPGRQHWPKCFSAILAGCGIRGGAVYGKSDKIGAAP